MLRNSGLLIKFNVAVMVVKLKCCESRGPRLLLFWWLNMLRNSVLLMFINVAVLVVKCCEMPRLYNNVVILVVKI